MPTFQELLTEHELRTNYRLNVIVNIYFESAIPKTQNSLLVFMLEHGTAYNSFIANSSLDAIVSATHTAGLPSIPNITLLRQINIAAALKWTNAMNTILKYIDKGIIR